MYLDDMLLIVSNHEVLQLELNKTIELLESLGFTVNREKSDLKPTIAIKHLGFLLDSKNRSIAHQKTNAKRLKTSASFYREKREF